MVNEDKRILRTRNNLKKAMLELINNKDFQDISITEITKVAHCNRVTFYSHYENSTLLLADIFQDYLNELAKYYRDSFKGKKTFSISDSTRNVPIFEFVSRNKFVFSLMLMGEVIPGSQNKFCDTILNISRNDLMIENNDIWFDVEAINSYQTYALLGFFIYWIKEGFKSTPEEMAKRLAFLYSTQLGEAIVRIN
ncbi:TetR/AcrR family transcriptional regulator [Cytobacillus horneckiae]|uniref:TetR/AcrR family transcriptional regulator n=1 Tax=Cytobacillus horneckiae TaxID=549687 RepID=A0A2N0ZFH1_9BACI|nr:TetR-like C-terminal domain-containing protein [Cytobacillus horneckiae]MCM3179053.1 TetR family transcriptional regulator C-terminal domain-containing protein [Cytobacillus horneckiae]MEC1154270.1 TetR-like C-terminal domain-containing protein [Cytobacillus horneckiae]MED2937606.1 TetR-like C-terminal domain-containing protein [Cytobacillus horneckiae]PKG28256.1 TetR/AcrR family transcriptional regulator [Cytobacillus horneckiae]